MVAKAITVKQFRRSLALLGNQPTGTLKDPSAPWRTNNPPPDHDGPPPAKRPMLHPSDVAAHHHATRERFLARLATVARAVMPPPVTPDPDALPHRGEPHSIMGVNIRMNRQLLRDHSGSLTTSLLSAITENHVTIDSQPGCPDDHHITKRPLPETRRSTNLFHVGPVAMPASRHAPPLTPIEPPPPEHTTDDVAPTTQHAIDQVVLGGEYLHDVTTEVSLGEFAHGHADFLELFDFGGKVREMS